MKTCSICGKSFEPIIWDGCRSNAARRKAQDLSDKTCSDCVSKEVREFHKALRKLETSEPMCDRCGDTGEIKGVACQHCCEHGDLDGHRHCLNCGYDMDDWGDLADAARDDAEDR